MKHTDRHIRPRSTSAQLPILSMVDAFVGAVSVLLILVLVVDPSDARPDQTPKADVVLTCAEDGRTFLAHVPMDETDLKLAFETDDQGKLPALLAQMAPPEDLMMRIALIGDVSQQRCLSRAELTLTTANNQAGLSGANLGAAPEILPPVFLVDLQFRTDDVTP